MKKCVGNKILSVQIVVNSQSKFHSVRRVEISEGNQRNSVWETVERGKKNKAKTGNTDKRGYIEQSPRESFPD